MFFGNLHLFQCFILLDFGEQKKDFMQQLNSFLYTFTGSLIMLIGILYFGYIYQQTTGVWSFNVLDWYSVILPFDVQLWLFIAFFMAFAVKVPMFPFHTWLPLAHGEAPTIGSIILGVIKDGNLRFY